MLDRTHIQEHYRNMRSELIQTVEGLSEAQLTERSLDGWSVKDHLTHIAFWDELRAADIVRISAGFPSGCNISDDECETLNQINHEMFADASVDQAWWEVGRAHRDVLDAISHATDRGLDPSLYAECGLQSDHEAEHIGWIRAWRSRQGY